MRAIWNFISSKKTNLPVFEGGGHTHPLVVVRSPRARAMRLVVDSRNGTVRLTLPRRASQIEGLRWAETKRAWVEGQLSQLPTPQPIVPGMIIPFGGVDLRLDWSDQYPRRPMLTNGALRIGGPGESLGPRLQRWLKGEAKALLERETHQFAAIAGVIVPKVGVGDPISRWGSCAASGDIRYSWRLILAPEHVRRATVAHEVAHRVHMNHSRAFHTLVAQIYGGDPSPARSWLRQHGASLHRFGRDH
jgi:predicted metal-dependent hydrolase